MSATTVYNALNRSINNDTIDLWTAANTEPDLSGMLPVLQLFGIESSYILTKVVLTQNEGSSTVRLIGQGSFTGKISYPVSATLQYLQESDTFSLSLTLSTIWGFSDFFEVLPDTLMQNPAVTEGITWYPSVLAGMELNNAVFTGQTGTEQLTLTGSLLLPDNAYLLAKTPMIGPWPLRLSGYLSLPDNNRNYPLLSLDAWGNSTIITAEEDPDVQGPATIPLMNPGLTLIIATLDPPQEERIAYSTIELYADFALGSIQGRISTLILSTGSTWNFSVSFEKDTFTLSRGIAQLLEIFQVPVSVPMNFPALNDFYVSEVDIDLENKGTDAFPLFSLLNLAITIRSDKTWQPPLPYVTLNNVGTRWVWGWSAVINEAQESEKVYTMNGSVFGTFNFGGESGNRTELADLPLTPLPNGSSASRQFRELSESEAQIVSFDILMYMPEYLITGTLSEESYIPIGQALTYYFGNAGPSTGLQSMNITSLRFTADPLLQNYYADAVILFGDPDQPDAQQGWEIDLYILTIVLNQLEFNISVNNGKVSGGIAGTFFIVQGDQSDYQLPRIVLSAQYPPQDPDVPEGWTLTGYLYPGTAISITQLVYQFIYGEKSTPPSWVPDLAIDRLAAVFTTGSGSGEPATSPSYAFGGTISARWEPTIFGTRLKINASASIDLEKPAGLDKATGRLTGTFSVNKIMLSASLTFGVPEATYLFKVQFDELWMEATTSWRGEQANRHQVVSLQLGGITLGNMLEYLVNLAAPTIGFRLDPPWDTLNKVELSRFVLTIDPQDNIVEFIFNADVDLVVAQVKSIGVRYSKNEGEGKVELILTGRFLGQQYPENKPLSWDVVNDPPPSVPGQGKSLVNLRYLGIGQRVTFKGTTPDTVSESISRLKAEMTPPPATGNPMPETMQYAPDSQWLIGVDIQLMETIDLGFIFNDPKLYGLSIALGGERAGSLAGLRFEILYKKITDQIGMFRIEFQVPDMFRTIQLGVVSLTLGVVVVEIYTNGNFKIDLGFPYNRNYERSFSLQAAIFIGRGGFYFGVLTGATSTQVPTISNGNFSPVIELGIGLAAGIGREIRAGILSGGAYLELEVIFQGALAWFNPNSNGAASATYFKCQGVAALHGKVYGSVNFSVIKVSVTLEAYAQVSIIYECYKPMLIGMMISVRAQASIRILFVRIHFSFSVRLEISFKVGSSKPTPWILSNGSSGNNSTSLQSTGRSLRETSYRKYNSLTTNRYLRNQALRKTSATAFNAEYMNDHTSTAAEDEGYVMNWQPANPVFPDAPRKAHLCLLPLFTIADVPVNWDATVPLNESPNYRTAFVLFADTGIAPSAVTASDCRQRSASHSAMTSSDSDTGLLAADIIAQGLLRYAINALPRDAAQGNAITAADLDLLMEQLDLPQTMAGGLSIDQLAIFFNANINLWISGDVQPRPDEKSAMVLPMPPFLSWISNQGGNVNFSTENMVGSWYEWGISQMLSTYFPVGEDTSVRPATDDPADYESFTSFMFRDFCLMVMQNGVTEMQKHLNNTSVTVQTISGVVQNLNEVAAGLPTANVDYRIKSGDTMDSVAEALGATVEELEFLNTGLEEQLDTQPVGTLLRITLGIAPEVLALDNAELTFAINQCTLGTLVHQAASTDTLQTIADLFQVAEVATLLEYQNELYPSLSAGSQILEPGSTFDIGTQIFDAAPSDYTQARTAAVFFVRYLDLSSTVTTLVPDIANWYVQAIASINQYLLSTLFPDQVIPSVIELPPGQVLSVPNSYNNAYLDPANCNSYTTANGDTLNRIGFALTFQQDYENTNPAGIPQWQPFKAGVTEITTQSWSVPAWTAVTIETGTSIASLVRRLIVDAIWTNTDPASPATGIWTYNWDQVSLWIATADVLLPLASVTVPDAKTAVTEGLNFTLLSETYGLTVTDAATRLKGLNNLFASGTTLLVKMLPAQDIDVLLASVMTGDSFAAIVNQSSRMLLSGLQLPGLETDENGHVVPNPDQPLPLYDLTGQQFSILLDLEAPAETVLSLSLSSEQSWIQLFNSITVQEGDTLEGLEATYPDLLLYNPGLNEETFQVGMLLLTATTEQLDYSYSSTEILSELPASGLSLVPIPANPPAPSVMPLLGTVPKTYGLDQRITLQSPVILPIPEVPGQSNVSGNPGLWMLPEDLLAKAVAGVTTLYEILAAPQGTEAAALARQINNSTYGTLIPFKMKRLDESSTQFNLIGVDSDQRNLLIDIRKWLNAQGANDGSKVYLLLAPAPDATNTSGLSILSAPIAETFLIKTNLSTSSVPPSLSARMAAEEEPESVYYTSLSSLSDFLTLLWEGSVVGGTGYYFGPGQDIPGSAFDEQGNITMQLLIIAGTQQELAPEGRSLLPFNNCVLIGTGTDTSQLSLYIESAGSTDPAETMMQALVPPGNIGFELLTANTGATGDNSADPEIQLQGLYSLLSFEVKQQAGSPFAAAPSGMPVLPEPSDGAQLAGWQKARTQRKLKASRLKGSPLLTEGTEDEGVQPYWHYAQVLPVSRFVVAGSPEAAAEVTGLPLPSNDPYQGFGTLSEMPEADFVFKFGDVLGNRTGQNGDGQGTTSIQVGYTDNLIGIGDWPAIARSFKVSSEDGQAKLTALISARSSELLPGPAQRGDVNREEIIQQQQQFSQIYYQFVQPGLTGWLVSSLQLISDPDFVNKGIAIGSLSPLWKFAAGAYTIATNLSLMPAAKPAEFSTLAAMLEQYGLRYTEIAEANADHMVKDLFGDALPKVPAYYPFVQHLSITAFYALPPEGWPLPETATTLLTLPENTILPLNPLSILAIPVKTIDTGSVMPTASLSVLSENNHTTVSDLSVQNKNAGVLQTGFEFKVEVDDETEIVVTVDDQTNSFQLVVNAFASQGVNTTVSGLAASHQEQPGMMAANKTLSISTYAITEGDTLAENNSGASITELAAVNDLTQDLFDPGALIYFGDFQGVTLGDSEITLNEFADRYACPMELLLTDNADFALPADSAFVIPGTLAWPEDTSLLSVPYTIRSTDTLNDIALRFGFEAEPDGLQLAERNENMPGTFLPDIELLIPVEGVVYTVNTVNDNPSFSSVLLALQEQAASATLTDVVNAMGDQLNVLCPGGLLICLPAKILSQAAPDSIPVLYGVSGAAFAQANTAMQNLIVPGVALQDLSKTTTILTQENDTFNSLIGRFATDGVQINAADIATANHDIEFIAAGAIALIPPAEISFTVDIAQEGPYPAPISPLQVSIRILRPAALIYPDFKTPSGNGPVEMAISDFPAPVHTDDDNDLNFNAFITAMEQALPELRLGTGKVNGFIQDLWQVNFNAQGIKEVALIGATTVNGAAQPRFFALKPLYKYLVTRTVSVAPLQEDGTLGVSEEISFQSIDAEVWARRFVEDLDLFLSGSYTVAVYDKPNIRNQLKTILDAKSRLIPLIAAGLDTVLAITDSGKAEGLNSAATALEQQLGLSLSKAYEATVLIQYDSKVDSAWQTDPELKPAALYGDGNIGNSIQTTVPNITLIAAKTDLALAWNYVNFMMTLDNPVFYKEVSGDFNYAISHIEFNISTEGLPDDYKASEWLTFLPLLSGTDKPSALSGTNPGAVNVPIPLRYFPSLPTIVEQQAAQQYADGFASIDQLSLWDYEFTYAHEHAAQDYVLLKVEFNLTSPAAMFKETMSRDLFTELAQYIAVANPLWDLLNGLTNPLSKQTESSVENAVQTFATLAGNVSQYWDNRLPQSTSDNDTTDNMIAGLQYDFSLRVTYRPDGDLASLTLFPLTGEVGPNGTWPEAYVKTPAGIFQELTAHADTGIYTVPDDISIPPVSLPVFKLIWTSLNVAKVQNARTQMNVERNQELIENVKTNPEFIFSTAKVVAPAVVTPLNSYGKAIDITALGSNLTEALNACFLALFGEEMIGQRVTIGLAYGFELVAPSGPSDEGITTYLPIGLYPNQQLTAETAEELNQVIVAWKDSNNPVEDGGEWMFSLKQYTQLTDHGQTLLNIEHLAYKLFK